MSTISSVTKEIVNNNSLINEALSLGIVSHAKLAEFLKPKLEEIQGKKINNHTIIMALRRYEAQLIKETEKEEMKLFNEIHIKTDISYLLLRNSQVVLNQINNFQSKVDLQKGEMYHITQDQDEITILTHNSIMKKILESIDEQDMITLHMHMVMIVLKYSKEHENSQEIFQKISWKLTRNNIKIATWIHKSNELILLLNEKDVIPTYNTIFKFKKTIEITPETNKKRKIKIISSEDEKE